MRSEPDPGADPYRTLGLEPGASMAEVKRAYRLLAKAFHPDSAGEAAVPRFLAIHAAYEQLKTGRAPSPRRSTTPAPPAGEPWRADPTRARAARERARTARAGRGGTPGAGTTGAARPAGGTRPTGSSGSARPSGAGGRASTGTKGGTPRRNVRKATMGSTSYDEARDPSDATWSGASWYGPSTGEYWIVNPREYADPRKHGPDYQSRSRRPADAEGVDEPVPAASFATTAGPAAGGMAGAGTPGYTAGSTWRSTTGAAEPSPRPSSAWSRASAGAPGIDTAAYRPGETARGGPGAETIGAASRAWLGGSGDDPIRRLGLALVAWPPIGLAAASSIGEITGCARYAAECGGPEPLLPWLAQALILGLLLLLPPVTRLFAGGSIAVLMALVPVTFFLIAIGGSGAPQAGIALSFFLGIAWLVGVAWAARTFRLGLATGEARDTSTARAGRAGP